MKFKKIIWISQEVEEYPKLSGYFTNNCKRNWAVLSVKMKSQPYSKESQKNTIIQLQRLVIFEIPWKTFNRTSGKEEKGGNIKCCVLKKAGIRIFTIALLIYILKWLNAHQ